MSSLPASMKRIGSKATEKRWRHRFPHYKSMGPFYCHGNQSFDPICPKTVCSLSPTPVMLHIKFDQDWPTGFRDIQVWKCGRRRTTTTTDGGPLVYYKLTLWAFGSGELKMGDPREKRKTPDHPQANLGLPHMWPELGSNPQLWDDEWLRVLKISILNHSIWVAANIQNRSFFFSCFLLLHNCFAILIDR